jgi:DNA invertase Pin-like site-specific DNA recombinase
MEKKIVAYYRVSKDSHEAGNSKSRGLGLDAQKQIVEHYYGKFIEAEFVETHSAKNIYDRPVLNEAMEYCIKHGCYLVTAKLDRLSRNVDDIRNIVKALNKKVIFCDLPSDGELDMFMVTLFAAFAERERELISLRTSQALKIKKEREGNWQGKSEKSITHQTTFVKTGDFSKMGVEANRKKAQDNENNIRASAVILDKRRSGHTYPAIAEILNENKFLSPLGKKFSAMQVKRIYDREINRITTKAA